MNSNGVNIQERAKEFIVWLPPFCKGGIGISIFIQLNRQIAGLSLVTSIFEDVDMEICNVILRE